MKKNINVLWSEMVVVIVWGYGGRKCRRMSSIWVQRCDGVEDKNMKKRYEVFHVYVLVTSYNMMPHVDAWFDHTNDHMKSQIIDQMQWS